MTAIHSSARTNNEDHERSDVFDLSRAAAVRLLFGEARVAAAAAVTLDAHSAWTPAVEACSNWGALPRLHKRMQELGLPLPDGTRNLFRARLSAVFLRSAACLHHGARALVALADAGIDAVGIKGVAAATSIYKGPEQRTLGDADLLIRPADLARAVAALRATGLQLDVDLSGYVEFTRRHPNVGNQSVSMFTPGEEEIDLHWRMGSVDVDAVLADAQAVDVYGMRVRVASQAHGFLLGVHHMLRNDFELDRGVRDLLDCQAWLDVLGQRDAIEPLAAEASRWGLAAPALAVAHILARCGASASVEDALAILGRTATDAERRQAVALEECFLLQRSPGRWNVDLPRMLDSTRLFRFLSRRLGDSSSYTPVAAGYDEPGVADRLRELGRSLPHTRWRLVWALKGAKDRAFKHDMEAM